MKPSSDTVICLPGEQGWELWKQGPTGMHMAESIATAEGGNPTSFKSATIMGYPVMAGYAVPVWAATADAEMVQGIVQMQLEKTGLVPENILGTVVDTKIVEREETQTLAVSAVLNESIVTGLPQQTPSSFELTPYLYYLPDNRLILWKELGRLVLVLTRREHPTYFHALTSNRLDANCVTEIEHLMMPLYTQGLVGDLDGISIWTEDTDHAAEKALADTLHLSLRRERKPPPAPPAVSAAFEPSAVALEKIRAARRRKVQNIVAACAAVYLALISFLVGKHLLQLKKNDEMKASVNQLDEVYSFVEPTLQRWNASEPVRNFERFPIELFSRALTPLSEKSGVRVTNFDFEKESITIKGEATSIQSANSYMNAIRTSKDLIDYEWQKTGGASIRGNLATFSITGNRKDAQPSET